MATSYSSQTGKLVEQVLSPVSKFLASSKLSEKINMIYDRGEISKSVIVGDTRKGFA